MDLEYRTLLLELARELAFNDLQALYFLAPARCPNFVSRTRGLPVYEGNFLREILDFFSDVQSQGSFSFDELLEVLHGLLKAAKRHDLANKITDFKNGLNTADTDGASSNDINTDCSSSAFDTSEAKGDVNVESSPQQPSNEAKKREKRKRQKERKKQEKVGIQDSVNLKNAEIAAAKQKALDLASLTKHDTSTNQELFEPIQNNQEPVGDAAKKPKEKCDSNADKPNLIKAISDQGTFPTLPADIRYKDDVQAITEKTDVTTDISLERNSSSPGKGITESSDDATNPQASLNVKPIDTCEDVESASSGNTKNKGNQHVSPNGRRQYNKKGTKVQKQRKGLPSDTSEDSNSSTSKSNVKVSKDSEDHEVQQISVKVSKDPHHQQVPQNNGQQHDACQVVAPLKKPEVTPDKHRPQASSKLQQQDTRTNYKSPSKYEAHREQRQEQVSSNIQRQDPELPSKTETVTKNASATYDYSNLSKKSSSEVCKAPETNANTSHSWYILVICDKWHGWGNSVTVFNRELCLALARAGHCVACIVLNSSEVEREEARKGNVELITCPEAPGVSEHDPQRFQFLDFGALPFAPNLVVGHGKVTGPAAVFYSEKKKALRLHVIHDLPDENLKYDNIVDKQCDEKDLARSADFVAAIGTLLHQTWSSVLNRDVMEIIPGLPNLETRNSISSPVYRYFVPTRFCSQLASGLSIAVEAINQSSRRNRHPNKSFLMIRNIDKKSTKSTPKVLREIDKKHVDLNVQELPERKQALIDLQGATLFLSPSRTESFGVSALDAIAIGIPVVISARSGLAQTICKHLPQKFHDCIKDITSECSGSANDDDEDDDASVWANAIDKASYDRGKAFISAEALKSQWSTMFSWDKAAQLIVDTIFKSGKLPSRTEKQHECLMSTRRIQDSTLKLVESLGLFDRRQKFVLLLSPCETAIPEAVHLGLVPWVAVFDFDRDSVTNGHLKMCENFLENTGNPACRMLPPCQKEEVKHLPNGIPWILLQGTADLPRSVDDNLDWIHEILTQIKRTYSCPVTLLTIWSIGNENKRLYKQLSDVLTVFKISPFWKNAIQLRFISTSNTVSYRLEDIAEEWETEIQKVDFSELLRAVYSTAISVPSYDANLDFSLPKQDDDGNVQHEALPQSLRWVDSVLELLYTTVGDSPEHGIDDAKHFYRGGKISWYGIEMNYAVERESWKPIKEIINNEIKFAGAASLALVHQRGTGGTTSARKILYDFHLQYPCVCLKTINHETFSALKVIWQFCSLPILILADLKDVSGADVYDIEALYSNLSNDKISCLIMHIVHQHQRQQMKRSNLHPLAKTLTPEEQEKFHQVYSSQCPQKRSALRRLRMDEQLQTPFYYGLVAFGDEFKGLEPFVQDCLKGLDDAQMLAMCFLGMALYYGQKEVPLSSLAGIFTLKPRQLQSLDDILPPNAMELLIEDACGCWRPRHHTIGKEMLCQLLTRPYGINKENWKLHLARKTTELISLVDEELISAILLNRISDENTFKQFSSLIEDIHDTEDIIKVLKEATKAHPENPFFKAHLGRFYSVKMGIEGFDDALHWTDEGILLATTFSRNVRSQLTQMKGIVYKRQVKNKIDKKASLVEIISLAIDGVKAFTSAASISPDKPEDSCIPQVRMMCDIFKYIDYTEEGGLFQYLKSEAAHPFILWSITDTSDVLETVSDSIHYPQLRKNLFRLGYRRQEENKEDLIAHFKELKKTNKTSIASINRQIVIMELELCRDKYKTISKLAGELIQLLEEALKYDEKIDLTMRLWIKVAPHIPVSLVTAESKIATWCSKGKSVTSTLYRYIFICIRILEGGTELYEDELKKMWHQLHEAVHSTSRDNLPHADSPVVFLGHGKGMGQLVLVEERVKEVRKKRTVPDEYYDRCRKLTGTITKTGKVGQIQAQGLTVSFRADLCEPTPLLGESYLAKKVTFCLAFTHFGADGYNVRITAD